MTHHGKGIDTEAITQRLTVAMKFLAVFPLGPSAVFTALASGLCHSKFCINSYDAFRHVAPFCFWIIIAPISNLIMRHSTQSGAYLRAIVTFVACCGSLLSAFGFFWFSRQIRN